MMKYNSIINNYGHLSTKLLYYFGVISIIETNDGYYGQINKNNPIYYIFIFICFLYNLIISVIKCIILLMMTLYDNIRDLFFDISETNNSFIKLVDKNDDKTT